jgi:hypothetical protein
VPLTTTDTSHIVIPYRDVGDMCEAKKLQKRLQILL